MDETGSGGAGTGAKDTGSLKAGTGDLGAAPPGAAQPKRWRRIDAGVTELVVFLVAVVGAVALGLGISDYFIAHLYICAYLIAYAGFRFADLLVREDFAPPPDTTRPWGSIIGQLPVLLLFAAAAFERTYIYGAEPARWIQAIGFLLELLGLWLALGARIQLGYFSSAPQPGAPRRLVRNGLYCYIRHPIYLGEFLVVFAWTFVLGAPIVAIISIIVAVIAGRRRIAADEARLLAQFGDEYAQYLRETDAIIPSLW
jgi:protein-S-isoprenylcysteine O-methyltransferase Ste14